MSVIFLTNEDKALIDQEIRKISDDIADKATLENNIIKFWKLATEENVEDVLLYSVDISSIGGADGLDLNNLTLSVEQVGEYQRLSMSDGTTTKMVDIPITVIADEQVQTAVNVYLTEHPEATIPITEAQYVTIDDNLAKSAEILQSKKLVWNSNDITDAADNFYVINNIPVNFADFPICVVDSEMNLKTVVQYSLYNTAGTRVGQNINKNSPISITWDSNNNNVTTMRIGVDRSAFADADEYGNWIWVWRQSDYERHVADGEFVYKQFEASRLGSEVVIPKSVNDRIVSNESLTSSIMKIKSRNLINKNLAEFGTRCDVKGNKIILEDQTTSYTIVCNHIRPNMKYAFQYDSWYLNDAYWLDENGNAIGRVGALEDNNVFISPNNAYGVIVFGQCKKTDVSDFESAKLQINEGDALLDYDEYDDSLQFKDEFMRSKVWSKYKYYAIGDSRTAGDGVGTNKLLAYPKVIQTNTGIHCTNGAVSGASFCKRDNVSYKTMFEQALEIPLDTDIVTVFGGTNDRVIGTILPVYNPVNERGTDNHYTFDTEKYNSIEEARYDVYTFKGAIRQTIKNIKTRCPNAIIIFLVDERVVSPDVYDTNHFNYSSGSMCWGEAYDGGESIKDMIESVCATYHIPVLNIARCSMTGKAFDDFVDDYHKPFKDNLHESAFGNEMLARAVAGEMSRYLW